MIPSPMGDYDYLQTNRLRLNKTTVSCVDVGNEGIIYLNNLSNEIEICSNGAAKKFQAWTQTDDTVSLTEPTAKIVNNGTYIGLDEGLTINSGSIVQYGIEASAVPVDIVISERGVPGFIWNPTTGSLAVGTNGLIARSLNTAATNTFRFGGDNSIASTAISSSITGGSNNSIFGNGYGFIGGGQANSISSQMATIGGGQTNALSGAYGVIGGGLSNLATADETVIGGGNANRATALGAGVFSGNTNQATATYAFVGGGNLNIAGGQNSTIAGGMGSIIDAAAIYGTIGGGRANIVSNYENTIAGGGGNRTDGDGSTIGGGSFNSAGAIGKDYATVAGGNANIASGYAATVGGGKNNEASGNYSFAIGENAKAKAPNSFALGTNITVDAAATNSGIIGNDAVGLAISNPNALSIVGLNVGIGTTAPSASLTVIGDIKQGPSGDRFTISSPSNLVMYRANVSALGTIVNGDSGVAASRLAIGRYRVTFPAMTNVVIVVTPVSDPARIATVSGISASSCVVATFNPSPGIPIDAGFNIIITGTLNVVVPGP